MLISDNEIIVVLFKYKSFDIVKNILCKHKALQIDITAVINGKLSMLLAHIDGKSSNNHDIRHSNMEKFTYILHVCFSQ